MYSLENKIKTVLFLNKCNGATVRCDVEAVCAVVGQDVRDISKIVGQDVRYVPRIVD